MPIRFIWKTSQFDALEIIITTAVYSQHCLAKTYAKAVRNLYRSSHSEVFLGKGVLKIRSKLTAEHPCRSAISIKLQSNFIEIALRHGCSPVNLLHIFRTPFYKNTSEWLLLPLRINFMKKAINLCYKLFSWNHNIERFLGLGKEVAFVDAVDT